ncbi:hypothetical protein [Desulfobulbus oligotrophicus]|uniref:Uncharacterized protein n=1 Tax=Desulfobulbus oligotrophicus TaxID=1909699 RepID=A0A7T5VEF2_9BACT|nr:hypothetical protein [Desulfobulbus oligotrophicus]QQG66372.1 hypothetical protein HP555_11075 [Desulfobulbus oligotrophicus]
MDALVIAPAPTNLVVKAGADILSAGWNTVIDADGYQVSMVVDGAEVYGLFVSDSSVEINPGRLAEIGGPWPSFEIRVAALVNNMPGRSSARRRICPITSWRHDSVFFEDINFWLPVISAVCGMVGGIFLAGKKQGAHESVVERQGKDIEGIKDERSKLLADLKEAVCDGFRLAIAELRVEQAQRHGGHDAALAALAVKMASAESDIVEIFGRLNRREYDYGRPEGDRRKNIA